MRMFRNRLPYCDELFKRYLSPWYPEEERPNRTRPDMYVIAGYENEKLNVDDIQYLTEEGLKKTMEIFDTMRKAYLEDFQRFKEFTELNIEVIDAIDNVFGRKEVRKLIRNSDPKDFGNEYLVLVCEFGLALGDLFVETGKFEWLYSYPYFHSIVVNPDTGTGITIFDWAVKKFSSYGIDDGIKAKFQLAIRVVEEEIEKKRDGK